MDLTAVSSILAVTVNESPGHHSWHFGRPINAVVPVLLNARSGSVMDPNPLVMICCYVLPCLLLLWPLFPYIVDRRPLLISPVHNLLRLDYSAQRWHGDPHVGRNIANDWSPNSFSTSHGSNNHIKPRFISPTIPGYCSADSICPTGCHCRLDPIEYQ